MYCFKLTVIFRAESSVISGTVEIAAKASLVSSDTENAIKTRAQGDGTDLWEKHTKEPDLPKD